MDGEMPSVYEEKFPIARKEHKCCECQKTITVGQKYEFFKGCWNGKWQKFRTCMDCHELRLDMSDHGEWPPFGELGEWAQEADVQFPVING